HGAEENDPLWRLPLWRSYDAMLDSKVADLGNVGSGGFAGSIVCALFLNRFVAAAKSWLHVDITGGAPPPKRGAPGGGGVRAAGRSTLTWRRVMAEEGDRPAMSALDPRTTPARPDLAASRLRGQVEAARFVDGTEREVRDDSAPLRREPSPDAPLGTEALRGERVTDYETTEEGWCWAQLAGDGYVGWLPANALGPVGPAATHTVTALRTLAFPGPSIKLPPVAAFSLGCRL